MAVQKLRDVSSGQLAMRKFCDVSVVVVTEVYIRQLDCCNRFQFLKTCTIVSKKLTTVLCVVIKEHRASIWQKDVKPLHLEECKYYLGAFNLGKGLFSDFLRGNRVFPFFLVKDFRRWQNL